MREGGKKKSKSAELWQAEGNQTPLSSVACRAGSRRTPFRVCVVQAKVLFFLQRVLRGDEIKQLRAAQVVLMAPPPKKKASKQASTKQAQENVRLDHSFSFFFFLFFKSNNSRAVFVCP